MLDFGCGIGGFLEFRPNTVGVDINTFNIDYCKSLGLNAVLLEEGGGIPFEVDSFSGDVMDNVIEHIPVNEVHSVIDEVIQILQPIGTIVVGVPGIKGYHSDSDHKVFYTEGDLPELFSAYGYSEKRTMHTLFYFPGAGKYIRQYCSYVIFEKSPGEMFIAEVNVQT